MFTYTCRRTLALILFFACQWFCLFPLFSCPGTDCLESTRNSQYIPTQDPLAEGSQLRNSSSEDTICHGLLSSADSSGIPFSASSLSDDPKNPLSHQRSSSVEDARSVFNTDPQLWTKEKTTSLNKWFDNYTSDEDDYDMVWYWRCAPCAQTQPVVQFLWL